MLKRQDFTGASSPAVRVGNRLHNLLWDKRWLALPPSLQNIFNLGETPALSTIAAMSKPSQIFRLRLMPPTDEDELSLNFISYFFDAKGALAGDKLSPPQERPHGKSSSGGMSSRRFAFSTFSTRKNRFWRTNYHRVSKDPMERALGLIDSPICIF